MRMHPTSDLFFSDPILQSAFLVTNGKRKRRIRGQAWHAKLFSCELLSSSQPSTAARSFLPCFAARDFFFFFSLSLSQKVFISSLFSQVFFSLHDVRGTGVEEGFACLCIDKPLDPFVPKNIPPRPMGALRALRRSRGSRRDARGNKPGTN